MGHRQVGLHGNNVAEPRDALAEFPQLVPDRGEVWAIASHPFGRRCAACVYSISALSKRRRAYSATPRLKCALGISGMHRNQSAQHVDGIVGFSRFGQTPGEQPQRLRMPLDGAPVYKQRSRGIRRTVAFGSARCRGGSLNIGSSGRRAMARLMSSTAVSLRRVCWWSTPSKCMHRLAEEAAENLAIKPLCFRQSPGLVMLQWALQKS